ncbi:MAG: Fic family protein [Nanoarchaeota archaeon]
MFVEIRKRGKDKKFYLVHPYRSGKKVFKITRYLGLNLTESQIKEKNKKAGQHILEQLKLSKEIRDPLKFILSPQELDQIKNLEEKIHFKVTHLSKDQWRRFSELFSYNTNAIEGSTLTLREVTNLVEKDKIPDKNPLDVEEVKGVVQAIDYIRKTKTHISFALLKKLHKIVFANSKSFAGRFREKGVEVVIRDGIGNVVHRGAPSEKVEELLQELIDWYRKNKNHYPGILLAAVIHNQFENIHPFQDGNGRVGRLLLNNILLKHNMPPVDIEYVNRQEYYQSLQEYENKGNIRPTIDLIIKEYNKLDKRLR